MKKAFFAMACLALFGPGFLAAQVLNGTFQTNTNTWNFDPERAFEQNAVTGWTDLHGTPSIHSVNTNPHAYMWSKGGQGEGIMQVMSFTAQCYEIEFKVRTGNNGVNDPNVNNATINVATARNIYKPGILSNHNPMLQATGSSNGWAIYPHTILSKTMGQYLGTTWHQVSTIFKNTNPANAQYLIFYPHMVQGSSGGSQAEMMIDDVSVTPISAGVTQFHFENASQQIKTEFDAGETIFLNGSACEHEEKYYIDIWSRPSGIPGNFVWAASLGWETGQLGTVNLTQLAAAEGYSFGGGMDYEIKVALQNQPCFGWTPHTEIFSVKNPTNVGGGKGPN